MLRMNMTQAEKDLVAAHKKGIAIYPAWKCNCCRQNFARGTGNPMFDIFRAPRGIRFTAPKVRAATYVICETCQKLPDAEITKGVIAGFLQEKLAVVVV